MLSSRHAVFDLVYKPLETRLLREAKIAGAMTIDGLAMLARQGERSFEIWTGIKPPAGLMERSARNAL
jgi:shikimate dehydrogenase